MSSSDGRACTQCNFRKIKCRVSENSQTCAACEQSGLQCVPQTTTKRRGPRATRIDALRQKQAGVGGDVVSQPDVATVPADVPERITGPVNQGGFDDVDFMMLLSSGTPQEGTLPSLDYSLDQQPVDDIPWLQWPETAIAQTDTRSLPFIDWARDSTFDFLKDLVPDAGQIVSPTLRTSPSYRSDTSPVDAYFEQCYPMFPVLDEHRVRAAVSRYQNRASPVAPISASSEWLVESMLALLETRGPSRSSHKLAAIAQKAIPIELIAHPDVDTIMGCLHLFVAYTITNDKMTAWFYLQQGLTLLLMVTSDDWTALSQNPELFRLYLILFICERGCMILEQHPPNIRQPLRLPDDAYGHTAAVRQTIPPATLADFPLSHLRLFSLIHTVHVPCWKGCCHRQTCQAWTDGMAASTTERLDHEMAVSTAAWSERGAGAVQEANLVITVAWLRDRFWNIFYRHGMVGPGRAVKIDYIGTNLAEATEFCTRLRLRDFDTGLDCNAKLFDMARTALSVIKVEASELLRADLTSSIYKVLGLLSMIGPDTSPYVRELRQALSEVF